MIAIAAVSLYATRDRPTPPPAPTAVTAPAATGAAALDAALGDSVAFGPGSDAARLVRGKPARAVSADAVALVQLSIAKPRIVIGDTVHVKLEAFDDAGVRVTTAQTVWTTSNPGVARFAAPGELVAVKEGKATITVTAGTSTAPLVVTVGARGAAPGKRRG